MRQHNIRLLQTCWHENESIQGLSIPSCTSVPTQFIDRSVLIYSLQDILKTADHLEEEQKNSCAKVILELSTSVCIDAILYKLLTEYNLDFCDRLEQITYTNTWVDKPNGTAVLYDDTYVVHRAKKLEYWKDWHVDSGQQRMRMLYTYNFTKYAAGFYPTDAIRQQKFMYSAPESEK